MREFLRNIIPRIQKYSKGLDKIEVFVDKTEPWIYIDDEGNQHQYIFMRDKRLIMSYNGIVKTGTWELLPTNQLLINRVSDEILLDHLFIENALLVLKKSATNDIPFVLINKDEIPDFDVEKYLEKFQVEKERKEVPLDEQKYKILSSGEISGPYFNQGKKIETDNGAILNGTYKTTNSLYTEYVEIDTNIINRVFYIVEVKFNGQKLQVMQKSYSEIWKGDTILKTESDLFPIRKYFKIIDRTGSHCSIKCDEEGLILKVRNEELRSLVESIILIFIFFILLALVINKFGQ
jgi:hypothetical protein